MCLSVLKVTGSLMGDTQIFSIQRRSRKGPFWEDLLVSCYCGRNRMPPVAMSCVHRSEHGPRDRDVAGVTAERDGGGKSNKREEKEVIICG